MKNLRGPRIPLPDTVLPGDFPIGSPESRAAARAMAERFPSLPDIISVYVEPLVDAEGKHIYGGQRSDSVSASVDYGGTRTNYDRNPGETLEDFENRVLASHPRGSFPRIVTLWPIEFTEPGDLKPETFRLGSQSRPRPPVERSLKAIE